MPDTRYRSQATKECHVFYLQILKNILFNKIRVIPVSIVIETRNRTMRKVLFAALVVIITGSNCWHLCGQEVETKKHWFEKHPIDFATGNFSVGMPFSHIFICKFYPMATFGTEFYYRNKKHSQIYQTARIGGYYNKYNTSALFLNTEIGYRYTFGFGLFADANLGAGYSHLFRPDAIYKLNSNGEYEQVRDWGKPSLMADFSLSVGYDFRMKLRAPVSVFLRYGSYIQLFYNSDLPALPQNSFQIGTRFFIHQKQRSDENK
jgi:hypothetical protein